MEKNINEFVTKIIWANSKNSDLGYAFGHSLKTRLNIVSISKGRERQKALAGNEILVNSGLTRTNWLSGAAAGNIPTFASTASLSLHKDQ